MIVKINGKPIQEVYPVVEDFELVRYKWKPKNNKIKKFATFMWTLAGSLLATNLIYAAPTSVWSQMQPVFKVFQDLAMVLGAISIMSGLIVMVFKKKLGWTFITTAGLVVLGCFLVPSAIMLVAIVGGMMNDALTNAFNNFNSGG